MSADRPLSRKASILVGFACALEGIAIVLVSLFGDGKGFTLRGGSWRAPEELSFSSAPGPPDEAYQGDFRVVCCRRRFSRLERRHEPGFDTGESAESYVSSSASCFRSSFRA